MQPILLSLCYFTMLSMIHFINRVKKGETDESRYFARCSYPLLYGQNKVLQIRLVIEHEIDVLNLCPKFYTFLKDTPKLVFYCSVA